MTAGGSQTILDTQNFAKTRLWRGANDHSQSRIGMNWVIIQKNSSDLGHFILTSRRVEMSVYLHTHLGTLHVDLATREGAPEADSGARERVGVRRQGVPIAAR